QGNRTEIRPALGLLHLQHCLHRHLPEHPPLRLLLRSRLRHSPDHPVREGSGRLRLGVLRHHAGPRPVRVHQRRPAVGLPRRQAQVPE
ncbi:hypothetical protein BN1708_020590, partial [Verticillium longisporum]